MGMIEAPTRLRIRRLGETCSHRNYGSGHAYIHTNLANCVKYKFYPANAHKASLLPNGYIVLNERYLRDSR